MTIKKQKPANFTKKKGLNNALTYMSHICDTGLIWVSLGKKTALITVENKIPDTSHLVKKTDYNTERRAVKFLILVIQ